MGICFSKKDSCSQPEKIEKTIKQQIPVEEKIEKIEKPKPVQETKKEIFIIKHRKSHDSEIILSSPITENIENRKDETTTAAIRTSSCTKDELDAILIQCGRLSRSSSIGSGGRKYSGSKRSYDFDKNDENGTKIGSDSPDIVQERRSRRTPSRERERERERSGSRERNSGRRVSRSPGRRRSDSPVNNTNNYSNSTNNSKPGKMVSVPPSVTNSENKTNVKRIQVKRNVGGEVGRSGASPRARSPAKIGPGLSRSNSKKGESSSPFRRNPLSEVDNNVGSQKQNPENTTSQVAEKKKPNTTKTDSSNMINSNNMAKEQEETKFAVNVISSGPENITAHPVTRTRSSRLSRDLDINPETLSNPNSSSYTALLLEDIQNFHQKNTNAPPPAFSLPPCVTKACSILEAVADLNSSTGSNLSEERRRNIIINSQLNKETSLHAYVESEVVVGKEDDLMEPSFHKYVTVRRGMAEGSELEEQESSGSNSFVSSQQIMGSSSSWEPTSSESTGRRTTTSSFSKPVSRNNESRISRSRKRT